MFWDQSDQLELGYGILNELYQLETGRAGNTFEVAITPLGASRRFTSKSS